MNIRIERAIRGGVVKAIASKSHAHRLLICAALSDAASLILCRESSDDIKATVSCLNSLVSVIMREGSHLKVTPTPPAVGSWSGTGKTHTLDCGESGTTYRFMLPICAALGVKTEFVLGGRLPNRPSEALVRELVSHGCRVSGMGGSPVFLSGKLKGGFFTLPGDVSSQFISGLMLALPLTGEESTITIEGKMESKHYVTMTLDVMRSFGVKINERKGVYGIPAGGVYKSPGTVSVEGDWSNAAFFLCAGAMGGGGVRCTGLNFKSAQGDMEIIEILRRFGATVNVSGDSAEVKPSRLAGIQIDAGDIPDLVPILAAVASVAEGKTIIYNAERLRDKESDRLRAVSSTLYSLGADIYETEDGLVIHGRESLDGGYVSSHNDHRIAMMAAIASIVCEHPVDIHGAEAVNKSYPGFFDDFISLGGEIWEV